MFLVWWLGLHLKIHIKPWHVVVWSHVFGKGVHNVWVHVVLGNHIVRLRMKKLIIVWMHNHIIVAHIDKLLLWSDVLLRIIEGFHGNVLNTYWGSFVSTFRAWNHAIVIKCSLSGIRSHATCGILIIDKSMIKLSVRFQNTLTSSVQLFVFILVLIPISIGMKRIWCKWPF